jgi:hypothetical protein
LLSFSSYYVYLSTGVEKDFLITLYLSEIAIKLKTLKAPLGVWGMKYTQHNLDKIEKVVEDSGYVIRYERGTFQSGYCILQDKKVVVLNKFFQTEGRINVLIDLMPQLTINFDALTHESQKVYDEVMTVENRK